MIRTYFLLYVPHEDFIFHNAYIPEGWSINIGNLHILIQIQQSNSSSLDFIQKINILIHFQFAVYQMLW